MRKLYRCVLAYFDAGRDTFEYRCFGRTHSSLRIGFERILFKVDCQYQPRARTRLGSAFDENERIYRSAENPFIKIRPHRLIDICDAGFWIVF